MLLYQRFMMELGKGLAFIGRPYRLEIGGDDFHIDSLFYNCLLHRFIAVELKVDESSGDLSGFPTSLIGLPPCCRKLQARGSARRAPGRASDSRIA